MHEINSENYKIFKLFYLQYFINNKISLIYYESTMFFLSKRILTILSL